MKKFLFLSILFLSVILSGCFVFRTFTYNFGHSIFSSPQKITNKIRDPVKPDVKLSALWIGHSSMLLQIYDKVIITDPLFNTRLGGFFMRKKEPGLDIENVPKLDMVLVSHSHIDHMSFGSLQMIADRFPGCALVFPMGDENYLPDFEMRYFRINNIKSQSDRYIGDPVVIDSIKITPVYALHTGGRYAIDTYIWKTEGATGYIIQYKDVCIYFAGDTGFKDEASKKIGNAFKIDLAFIPMGPCRNCDSAGMRYHASSIEALKMFVDLKAQYMMPMHYGAITYFGDPSRPRYALEDLINDPASGYYALRDRVKLPNEGEQIIFGKTDTDKTEK